MNRYFPAQMLDSYKQVSTRIKELIDQLFAKYSILQSTWMATSNSSSTTVNLKLMIDKKRKKVLFAEAGKDFVDFSLHSSVFARWHCHQAPI